MKLNSGPFLYPNVTQVPGAQENREGLKQTPGIGQKNEFNNVLKGLLDSTRGLENQIKPPLKFSAHAMQRLNDRQIKLDPETMERVNAAIDKAEAKGVQDTLVLTDNAAWIVSVKNRTVITAMDRDSLSGNVFTNIDGAIIA